MFTSRRRPIDVWLATSFFIYFYFAILRFLSRVCLAYRRQGYDWVDERLEGENVSAHEWPRYRSLLGYNLRTIISFTPALRVKRCPLPAASGVRALTRFYSGTPHQLPTTHCEAVNEKRGGVR